MLIVPPFSFLKAPPPEKKRKETLLSAELGKYLEKKIRVKFQGGREGTGQALARVPDAMHYVI